MHKMFDEIETVKAVLESGSLVELRATGYSMFPTLRSGDRVIIKPVVNGELPVQGSVVVCVENGKLVLHRLVEMKNDASGNSFYITRGDSIMESDQPWSQNQLLGIAVSYKRRKNEQLIKIFIPGKWRYKYNRRLLWVFNKVKRLILFKEGNSRK
jgi:signal peptidase I